MSSLSKNVYSLYRTQIVPKMKPCPDLTEGRGSEVRPPVESITQLFLYKGNIEEEKKGLANVAVSSQKQLLPPWMRKMC